MTSKYGGQAVSYSHELCRFVSRFLCHCFHFCAVRFQGRRRKDFTSSTFALHTATAFSVLGELPICCIFVLDQLICRPNGAGSSFITTRASNRISSIPASKAMSSAKSRSVNTFSPRVQPQHPLCMVRFINQSMDTVLQTGLRLFCILGSHHSLPETNQM